MEQTDIILKHISKEYNGAKVLSDFNMTFLAGHAYCLTAPSGTGKTTLFKILMGLVLPDAGTVRGTQNLRISAVFQEDRLLERRSAIQNIRFVTGRLYSDALLRQKLSLLLPTDCLDRPVFEFSGGMKRRLSILRALLSPFDLLLLDEPFSGLDQDNRLAALQLIQKEAIGKTVILATHEPADAAFLHAETVALPAAPTSVG